MLTAKPLLANAGACGIRPAININAKPLASDLRCVIADLLRGCITHNHACRLVKMGLAVHTSARAHYVTAVHLRELH